VLPERRAFKVFSVSTAMVCLGDLPAGKNADYAANNCAFALGPIASAVAASAPIRTSLFMTYSSSFRSLE
jgi:hypothetical protein